MKDYSRELEERKRKVSEKMKPVAVHKYSDHLKREKEVWSKKGRESLNIPKSKTGKDEGNHLYEGKDEQERQ